MPSATICEALAGMEDRPWPEWGRANKAISTRGLASLLRPLGITPGTKREGAATFKGYRLDTFKDAFSRYLPPTEPSHRHNPQETAIFGEVPAVTPDENVTAGNVEKPKETATCDGVTAGKGENRGNGEGIPVDRANSPNPDDIGGEAEWRE